MTPINGSHRANAPSTTGSSDPWISARSTRAIGASFGLLALIAILVGANFTGIGPVHIGSAVAPNRHAGLSAPLSAAATVVPTQITSPSPYGGSSISSLSLPIGASLPMSALQPLVGSSSSRLSAGGPYLGAPRAIPAGASTPSNWYVGNYGWLQSATAVGISSTNLIAAGADYGPEVNFSTSPTFMEAHGIVGISHSTDGGASWKTNWPGQATSWTTAGASQGDIFTQDLTPGTGYNLVGGGFFLWNNLPSALPTVVSNGAGSDLLMAAPYSNICYYEALGTCTTNGTYNSNAGTAVVQSTNGGSTWGTPVPVFTKPFYRPAYYSNGCSGTAGTGILALPANQTLGTSLAMGGPTGTGSNYAYLAMDVMSISTTKQGWACSSGGLLEIGFTGMNFTLEISTSSDGGASWGAPRVVADVSFPAATLNAQQFPIAPLLLAPHITVGPAPHYTVHVAYLDIANLSSQTGPFPIATLTNNSATTFNAPGASGVTVFAPDATGPDWFMNGTLPVITADNWSASPHSGNLYMAYNDNLSASSGTPSIEFSANTGSAWSSPKTISQGNGLYYANPSVSIQPNGTIWVVYTGENPSTGAYRLYGTYSTDAGTTWSGQFPIADQLSTPNNGANAQAAMGISAVVTTSSGAFAFWSDCRSSNCVTTSGFFNWTVYTAFVNALTVSSNAAGVTATITIGGAQAPYNLPVNLGWDTNASVTISVNAWIATPNGTYIDQFASFTGADVSTSNPSTFTYPGGNLVAHYVLTPGSWISGTVAPRVAGVTITVVEIATSQSLKANPGGVTGPWTYNVTVPGSQSYSVTVSAPKYQTQTSTVGTTNFKASIVPFVLAKVNGWIAGTVSASTGASGLAAAVLTVNDTAVPAADFNRTSGRFNVSEAWGTYYVNVTSNPSTAYVPYTPGSALTVAPGATASVKASLKGSWINGSITPYPVTVTINGAPVTLTITGNTATWVDTLPGGTYDIVAHQPGYSVFNETYTVPAGTDLNLTASKGIVLVNSGLIQGTIAPSSNNGNVPTLFVNNATESVLANGQYKVSVTASSRAYNLSVKLLGYQTSDHQVLVTPGNTTWLNITLTKPVCTSNCNIPPNPCSVTPQPANCTSHSTNNGGLSTLDYVGIGVIVLLVVLIAAVFLMRRGKGGGSSSPPPSQDAPMESEAPATPVYGQDGGSTAPPASP